MTFTEQLNTFFTSQVSRSKLVTLRTIWRDRCVHDMITSKGTWGADYEKLMEHLKATNPPMVTFVESITNTSSLCLDAVMRIPMRIPLTRQPITLPL